MSNTLNYKGYDGSVEFSAEDGVLFGRILGIRALVSYEAEDLKRLRQAFAAAVDDYLSFLRRNRQGTRKAVGEITG